MPELIISARSLLDAGLIEPEAPLDIARTEARGEAREAPFRLRAEWLGEDGATPAGEPFLIEVARPMPVEAFRPSGEIEHVRLQPGAEVPREAPPDARFLRIERGRGPALLAPLVELREPPRLPDVAPIPIGPPAARFRFPVFAERFTDRARFEAMVRSLHQWISGIEPFTEAGVRSAFAIDAYYWRSPGPEGHFRTSDIVFDCHNPPANAVIFSGDNLIAKRKIGDRLLGGRYGLVLIDSHVRGGAGGLADQGSPAWSSITGCGSERWEAVCLHEIGHALGLADEYLDRARSGETPRGEPNCSTSSTVAHVPWRSRLPGPPAGGNYLFPLERQRRILERREDAPPSGFVGLFQGSRYSENYYRPSLSCLMRATNVHRFCAVCSDHIRARIGSA